MIRFDLIAWDAATGIRGFSTNRFQWQEDQHSNDTARTQDAHCPDTTVHRDSFRHWFGLIHGGPNRH